MTNKGKEIDNLDLIKTETFSVANNTSMGENICKTYVSDKELISRVYKKLL